MNVIKWLAMFCEYKPSVLPPRIEKPKYPTVVSWKLQDPAACAYIYVFYSCVAEKEVSFLIV